MARGWPRRLLTVGLRLGLVALALLLVLAGAVAGLGVRAVRDPFPTHDGELALPGLSAPVTVYRDGYGIPQIYAETTEDLFRAQGYVHAQDRFWEMDFRRHVTSGRLAEWFGPDQVETDTFLRTLGWRRVAEAEWAMVAPATRRYLTAYAEGVNAWVEATGGPAATDGKAFGYRLLGLRAPGYRIEPWQPVDSLAWLKAMAWDLRGNIEDEVERATLLASGLTRERVEELFPPYRYDEQPPIVPGYEGSGGSAGGDAGVGSNSWVVSGEHTATGAPILVNDPHLSASMPGIWYQVGLHCSCGYRVTGFSFAGLPGVVIGHNDRIAWGFTNLGHDVTDLYLERVDGDRYQVDGAWRDMAVREETIRVAGGDDVTIRVRETHRGPVMSDASEDFRLLGQHPAVEPDGDPAPIRLDAPGDGYAVSLAWTALRPGRTIEALFVLNQAQNWDEFRAAAALFEVPAQNLTYADADGNIGYQAPGKVPVRGAGDGRWPVPGWDSAHDWTGYLPFDELPNMFNPDGGSIVTANQAVVGPAYPHLLTGDWSVGYRGNRIRDLLDGRNGLSVSDMEVVLFDNYHGLAPTVVPALLAAPAVPLSRSEQAALDLLRNWDYQQPVESAPAAYFNAVWRCLLRLAFDELPEDYQATGRGRWLDVVAGLLEQPDSWWWDRRDTAAVETRDHILARALADAYRELEVSQGDEPRDWRWGRMHTLTLAEATFGSSGIGPVEALFNRGPVEAAGGADIVNATSWEAPDGYAVTVAPSMRMIVDLSNLDGSRWVQLTGNSAHPYHPNYTDQLELWRTGQTLPWRWTRPAIEAEATDTLVLAP
jgi:penicillin amidase